ncbi:MAG: hypothetical protein K0S38_376 [Candidatus Paceibacter sp.]|jgi:hypothetical protein|nr:hypothetical protein [Candidatus Paceibacter sp.]
MLELMHLFWIVFAALLMWGFCWLMRDPSGSTFKSGDVLEWRHEQMWRLTYTDHPQFPVALRIVYENPVQGEAVELIEYQLPNGKKVKMHAGYFKHRELKHVAVAA